MNYETKINGDIGLEEVHAKAVRRRRLLIIVQAAAIAGIAGSIGYRFLESSTEKPGSNPVQIPTVTVAVPGLQSVTKTANAVGSLAARIDMPVGVLGEGGRVTRVLVQPGDWVSKGQILAVIERSVQAEQIASLAAQVEGNKADAKLAQNNLDRAKTLLAGGFISKANIDQKIAARDSANAQVDSAVAKLNEMRAQVRRLDIRAPEAGLVLTRNVEPGQVITAGSGTLFRIAKDGEVVFRAQLSEDELASVQPGTGARVTPVGTREIFIGHVWQVSPVVDAATRQGIARVALSYKPSLRPGGFANAEIDLAKLPAAVLPESAIQSDQNGNFVYVVGPNNKVERRPVVTGAVTDSGVAVTKGLTGNEKVVLYAGGFLRPGQAVTPKFDRKR